MKQIQPISEKWLIKAKERLDNLTKPKGSLGLLEEIAARYVAIREEEKPKTTGKEVFVFVGDHDVVSEGVSAYPQEVTNLMVGNFLAGGAGINVLARCAKAKVSVIDIGMKNDLPPSPFHVKKQSVSGRGNRSLFCHLLCRKEHFGYDQVMRQTVGSLDQHQANAVVLEPVEHCGQARTVGRLFRAADSFVAVFVDHVDLMSLGVAANRLGLPGKSMPLDLNDPGQPEISDGLCTSFRHVLPVICRPFK